MTEKEKAERYDLIVGYFQNILTKREDALCDEYIYYDEWKQPRHMDDVERSEQVEDEFLYDMDNIGFHEFAELMAHEVYGTRVGENNQFYDHIYG